MEIMNCRECRRLFNYIGGQRLCPACKAKLEDKFQQVKKYIYENKDAPITQISEENEVSVQQIKQWVREERLRFSDDSPVGVECERCGAMIHMGKYCDECKKHLATDLGLLYKREESEDRVRTERQKARMRFLDK